MDAGHVVRQVPVAEFLARRAAALVADMAAPATEEAVDTDRRG
jgi:hypothetical protein